MGALALATEDPNPELLNEMPHGRNEALITKKMWKHILVQGLYQVRVQTGDSRKTFISALCLSRVLLPVPSFHILTYALLSPGVSTAVLDDVQPLCLAVAFHVL